MASAGCFCEKVRLSIAGEKGAPILCHCLDCRKISGSTYSVNIILPDEAINIEQGTPKTITKTADSGSTIVSSFCGDCGTTLFRISEGMPGKTIIKAGILDDPEWPDKNLPVGELFAPHRVAWVNRIDGAAQMKAMS